MRASFPREPALRPTPSTEPTLFLEAGAPVGNTSFDVCHADPPRVVTAGRAFTTKIRRPLTSLCRLQAPPTESIRWELVARAALAIAPDLRRRSCDRRLIQRKLAPSLDAPSPPPFDDVSEENLLARSALTPPRWRDSAASIQDVFHRID